MTDKMAVYRAFLSARDLADALLAAHHDEAGRKHHLRDAEQYIEETRARLHIVVEPRPEAVAHAS